MWNLPPSLLRSAVVLATALVGSSPAAADVRGDDAFRRALALEARGDVEGALGALQPLVALHPEDYFLFLQLGWLYFRAEDHRRAEASYERARDLSGGAADAWLGLGWVYLRTDRPERAVAAFERVLAKRPGDASALEGRELAAAAARPFAVSAEVTVTGHLYADHPLKEWGVGVAPALDARIARRLLVGGTYRLTEYALRGSDTGGGPGPGSPSSTDLRLQHEVHARLGLTWPVAGVMAHFAWAEDDTSLSGETWVGGLSLRLSLFGDLVGEASASFVDDANVLRGALAWAVPVTERVTLQPGVSLQRSASRELLPDASLLLRARRARVTCWVGGRYGRQERPAYLGLALVYNTLDRMLGGAFGGVRYDAPSGFYVFAAYEWQALETPVGAALDPSHAHFLSLGLGGTP